MTKEPLLKKIIDWVFENIIYIVAVLLAIACTPTAIELATRERGYGAVGGEYMLIPLALLVAYFIKNIAKGVKSWR